MEYKKSTYKKKTAAPKVQYKPKRGNTDGSGFTVQGERLKYKQKRVPLSKLMTEEAKASAGIHELSYDFGCRTTRLFQYLTEDTVYKEYVISKQIYRSGTSIGANVRESKHAQSDADFLSKMSIAYKEADETDYWLEVIHSADYFSDEEYKSLKDNNDELLKLLTSIIKTTRENSE